MHQWVEILWLNDGRVSHLVFPEGDFEKPEWVETPQSVCKKESVPEGSENGSWDEFEPTWNCLVLVSPASVWDDAVPENLSRMLSKSCSEAVGAEGP